MAMAPVAPATTPLQSAREERALSYCKPGTFANIGPGDRNRLKWPGSAVFFTDLSRGRQPDSPPLDTPALKSGREILTRRVSGSLRGIRHPRRLATWLPYPSSEGRLLPILHLSGGRDLPRSAPVRCRRRPRVRILLWPPDFCGAGSHKIRNSELSGEGSPSCWPRRPLHVRCAARRLVMSSLPPWLRGMTWSATGGSFASVKGSPQSQQVTASTRILAASRV